MPATSDRLAKLQQMLEKSPADPFLLYGVALEYKKLGEHQLAIDFLERTLQVDAGYCYAYFQKGQIYETMGEPDKARSWYEAGVAAAKQKGDAHAQSELEGALSML